MKILLILLAILAAFCVFAAVGGCLWVRRKLTPDIPEDLAEGPPPAEPDLRGATHALEGMGLVKLSQLPAPQRIRVLRVGDPRVIPISNRDGEPMRTAEGEPATYEIREVMIEASGAALRVAVSVYAAAAWRLVPGRAYMYTKEDGEMKFVPV